MQQDEQRITLETSALRVVILREPWQMLVYDHVGRKVWTTRPVDIEPLRRPVVQWNPAQERWLFLHRYAYPCGMHSGDRQVAFASFDLHYDEHT